MFVRLMHMMMQICSIVVLHKHARAEQYPEKPANLHVQQSGITCDTGDILPVKVKQRIAYTLICNRKDALLRDRADNCCRDAFGCKHLNDFSTFLLIDTQDKTIT